MIQIQSPSIQTSRRMQKVRSRGTGLEKSFALMLRKNHLRYQTQPKLYGNPDFRIRETQILIFCDSSFWHGRRKKELTGRAFKRNVSFWTRKLSYNRKRDRSISNELRKMGWVVLRFWDDQIFEKQSFVLNQILKHAKTKHS